jgi:hypothetical protein
MKEKIRKKRTYRHLNFPHSHPSSVGVFRNPYSPSVLLEDTIRDRYSRSSSPTSSLVLFQCRRERCRRDRYLPSEGNERSSACWQLLLLMVE